MAKNRRSHVNVGTGGYEARNKFKVRPKRRPPSQSKIREAALNSHDGGRMRCDYCTHTFAASYVRTCFAKWPQEPRPACRDCRESRNLRVVS